VNKVEVAYTVWARAARAITCAAPARRVETGQCKVAAEISNAGYQCAFWPDDGHPFIPSRNMLGTDTFEHSACKSARDP